MTGRPFGIDAPKLIDGGVNGESVRAHVRQVSAPSLRPGGVVIMGDLGSHKGVAMREAIEAVGAELRVLPPCNPDFNPIGNAVAKLEALLRTVAARTRDALWAAVARAVEAFSPGACACCFTAAGHEPEW